MSKSVRGFAAKGISALAAGLVAAIALALPGAPQAAEVKLMVEPSYPPDKAAEVFKPLAEYLSKTTGHKITLLTPRNYHFFWRDVRQNVAVDLMFAEPHITDYRVKRSQVEPLVRSA